jgi:hypothetical protein
MSYIQTLLCIQFCVVKDYVNTYLDGMTYMEAQQL